MTVERAAAEPRRRPLLELPVNGVVPDRPTERFQQPV